MRVLFQQVCTTAPDLVGVKPFGSGEGENILSPVSLSIYRRHDVDMGWKKSEKRVHKESSKSEG